MNELGITILSCRVTISELILCLWRWVLLSLGCYHNHIRSNKSSQSQKLITLAPLTAILTTDINITVTFGLPQNIESTKTLGLPWWSRNFNISIQLNYWTMDIPLTALYVALVHLLVPYKSIRRAQNSPSSSYIRINQRPNHQQFIYIDPGQLRLLLLQPMIDN